MGVFSTLKKMPRRVKKTVRRSLSGVLMASAIIVAAIPPEVNKASVTPTIENSYAYGVTPEDTTDLSSFDTNLSGVFLDKYDVSTGNTTDGSPLYKTMTVKQLSGGAYEIGWQFKLYTLSNGKGVICEYNSMYATGTLEIDAMLPLSYIVVEESFFDNYFAAHSAAKQANSSVATIETDPDDLTKTDTVKSMYSISEISPSVTNTSDQFVIEHFFPDEYGVYKSKYDKWVSDNQKYKAYQNAYNAWLSVSGNAAPPEEVINPGPCPTCTVWVADMQLTDKYRYFCAEHPYYVDKLGGLSTAMTYALEKVVDSRAGSTTPSKYCYMPKGAAKFAVNSIDKNDEFGFLGSNWTTILGIGDYAFANTTNVTSLQLCDEMKYIGDYAFYNSFVETISFVNVQDIGNRAFKDCTRLKLINLGNTTVNIGTEAFYGCNMIANLTLPETIAYVGPGSFAECTKLSVLDLSKINKSDSRIDAFAFYDDIALSTVSFSDEITKIGDCAFAVNKGVTGNLLSFTFPAHMSAEDAIGNFLLAGRTNLLTVKMPADYGRSVPVTLPFNVFYNCINLKSVTFPQDGGGSCGFVTLGKSTDGSRTIFDTIQTQEFCVYGPENDSTGKVATTRTTTWGLKTGLGNDVPYIYTNSTGEHVEISNGEYILIIDDNGVLQSCQYANNEMRNNARVNGLNLRIPEYVGDTKVTGVSSTCFSDPDIHDYIKNLEIADNTISSIAPDSFKDCTMLQSVKIGNSVTEIGANAFAGCNNLKNITFSTPKGGYSSFPLSNIGENAFSTGASELTITGDIDESYGPFVWATDFNNYVDETQGIRVCYKSSFPTYLTVIVDNRNGYATLVDYPHYEQLNALSGTVGDKTYIDGIDTVYRLDGSAVSVPFDTDLITRYENLGNELYDENNNVVYTYSINLNEEKLVNSTLFLDVPSGIESIDVNGYMNNNSELGEGYSPVASNSNNVSTYLVASDYYQTYRSIGNYTGGLFKGYYGSYPGTIDNTHRDYPAGNSLEMEDIGNDRLKSITLHSVEYLPDYAFYSCENLSNINLGNTLTKMGVAPFTGCTSLTGIGSQSNNFICNNGIVYSENQDGTYNIVEILSARGKSVGSQKIKASDEDPYLANVSTISDGAFENCDYITGVDFTGISLLKEIPDNCFKNCDKLNQIILPENITSIGKDACAGCMNGIELVCYGREVYLSPAAFGTKIETPGHPLNPEDGKLVEAKRVISYKDSAVRKAAADLGADVSEVLDDTVKLQFFDFDGRELSPLIYVTVGDSVRLEDIPADPIRTGYKFAGWNKPLTNIQTDSVVVATYSQDTNSGNTVSGNDTSGNNSGNNSGNSQGNNNTQGNTNPANPVNFYTLTVTNGNGSGSYAEGATVIITCTNPPSGQVFDKWVPATEDLGIASVNVAATTLKMPAHEASVTATFKNAPTNTNGSSGNSGSTSGNNPSNPVNNGNTVLISKPGISNTSLASVQVTGSNDNYVVRIAETAAATAAVEKALTNEYGSLDTIRYSAMDITLYDATGTNKITNYSGLSVQVTIPLPDVMTQYAGNNKVAGVVNEKLDKLTPKFITIDGVPCVTFTATHFSPYTIYVDTGHISSESIIDGSPKTGDGIRPKWFLVAGLAALSIALFFMKDKRNSSQTVFSQA